MIDWLDHCVLTLLLGPAVAILRQAKVEGVCIHCRDTIPGCGGNISLVNCLVFFYDLTIRPDTYS